MERGVSESENEEDIKEGRNIPGAFGEIREGNCV